MYEYFSTIRQKPGIDRDLVIETKYDLDSLRGKFIVWFEGDLCRPDCGRAYRPPSYRVYPHWKLWAQDFEAIPEDDRVFHEVVFGAQKLKFDIDADADKLAAWQCGAINEDDDVLIFMRELGIGVDLSECKYAEILRATISAMVDAFSFTFDHELDSDDIIICESKCPRGSKWSAHIIIDGWYVPNFACAQEFTHRTMSHIPASYHQFIDVGVNKRVQNFRLAGCHKNKSPDRVKIITTPHQMARTYITNIDGCTELKTIAEMPEEKPEERVADADVEAALEICVANGIMNHHEFRSIERGSIMVFSRINASMCEFCRREHPVDNTLIIYMGRRGNSITLYKQCRRYNDEHGRDGTHSIAIGSFVSEIAGAEPIKAIEWVNGTVEKLAATRVEDEWTLFDALPAGQQNKYCAPALTPFEFVPILAVRAAMKMGKTKALAEYLNTYFRDGMSPHIIRFVSFRQTFSANIKAKFPDFVMYSDIKGAINDPRVIIQVESLHRLTIRPGMEVPDLLILDECESIFEQFNSGLLRGNFAECFAKFQYLVRWSKHIVLMDANMGDRTYRMLEALRPGCTGDIIYHYNEHRNGTADTYHVTGDEKIWLEELHAAVAADIPIVIPCSSRAKADVLARALEVKFPLKTIKCYSKDTSQAERRLHFGDVDNFWRVDVLIYTPTISAGVSFEAHWFEKMFCYFVDTSCPVETCMQMMGRIRNIGTKEYFVCIYARGNNQPTSIEDIRAHLHDRRLSLFANDIAPIDIEYNEDGSKQIHDGPYFQLWAENIRMQNLSRNGFLKRFLRIIGTTGATITQFEGLNAPDYDVLVANRTAAKELKIARADAIANAPDATMEEIIEMGDLIATQADLTPEQKNIWLRAQMRIDYKYDGEIDSKFVLTYDNVGLRRAFKGLCRAWDFADATLMRLRVEERTIHQYLVGGGQLINDLSRRYVSDNHIDATKIVRACGWKSPIDETWLTRKDILLGLAGSDDVWPRIQRICKCLNIRIPKIGTCYLDTIKTIASVIKSLYGARIDDEGTKYIIRRSNKFTYSAETSVNKKMPLVTQGIMAPK